MSRISRHLFTQCALASLVALLVMTALIMLPRTLSLLDTWINSGVGSGVFGRLLGLALPQYMAGALPLAVLVGVLMALDRMARESELVILRASGLSLYRIGRPIAVLVGLFTLFSALLSLHAVPWTNRHFNDLKSALASSVILAIRPGVFTEEIDGLTIMAREVDRAGWGLRGILVHDRRGDGRPYIMTAAAGRIVLGGDGRASLLLHDGTQFRRTADGQHAHFGFRTLHFDLDLLPGMPSAGSPGGAAPGIMQSGPRDRSLHEATAAELDARIAARGDQAYAARVERHRRWAFPMATLIMGLLAIPLGFHHHHRAETNLGFPLGIALLLIHFGLLTMGRAFAERQLLDPAVGLWLPNLLMAAVAVALTVAVDRGWRPRLPPGVRRLHGRFAARRAEPVDPPSPEPGRPPCR